jgi:predicted ferric reductase
MPAKLSVFLCGSTGMVRSLQADLHRAGVPTRQIHHEYFDLR